MDTGKGMQMLRRVLMVSGVAVLAMAASGCIRISGTFPASALPNVASVATAAADPPPITHGVVGEKLSAQGWTVTLERAETTAEKVGGVKPAKDSEFLIIDVGFENKGTDALEVRAEDFELTDRTGAVVPRAEILKPAFNARSMRPLLPRFGTSTAFVYQVPKGLARYAFTFSPRGAGKKPQLEWQVP